MDSCFYIEADIIAYRLHCLVNLLENCIWVIMISMDSIHKILMLVFRIF